MKKTFLSILSFILALTMIAGAFVSCTTGGVNEPSGSEEQESHSEGTTGTTGTTDSTDREESSDERVDKDPVEPSEHINLIQEANGLANGIQAFFTDGSRTHLSIQNQEMILNYARSILS